MKILLTLCFITFISVGKAQTKITGVVEYICIWNLAEYNSTESQIDTNKLNENKKHLITKSNVTSLFRHQHLLVFNALESVFYYQSGDVVTPTVWQDFDKKMITGNERAIRVPRYLVVDTMTVIAWKLSKNTKKIQNIECFSAQAEYRGRVWTAWYAPSIPISSGPWKLYGLPGLILEAEDKDGFLRFENSSIQIPQPEKYKINVDVMKDNKIPVTTTKRYALIAEKALLNAEKMETELNGQGTLFSMSGLEIFDFEKNLSIKRIQQKLSDIPKK